MRRSDRKTNEPDLGMLASRLLFAVQDEMFTRLAAAGHDRLRPQHGAVLAFLDEEGSRATDLARRSGQHKQVIGKLVDELELLGYVERRPDPHDRRAKLVVPTARGLDEMRRSDAIVEEIAARHRAELGDRDFGQFLRTLSEVTALQRAWRRTEAS